jgi:AcrR family transcriptional regulator
MRKLNKAPRRRRYEAPRRVAAAAQTRERVLRAAKATFEKRGWAGATIPAIARAARVSHQTVEATFGTKAALLQATVDFSIRGDVSSVPMRRREVVAEMEAAPTTAAMLDLHAQQVRSVSERSAAIAWAVEHAATSDRRVARLWRTMTDNRRFAVAWAAETLLAKPDALRHLERDDVEDVFWLALDWNTYRTLARDRGFLPDEFEAWLRRYYRGMLGA